MDGTKGEVMAYYFSELVVAFLIRNRRPLEHLALRTAVTEPTH
jgi:hypothetical protein